VWGAATSAYQIEGAALEGGRGPSIYEPFCARPGAVHLGQSGARAASHYGRWREDVGLMRDMGLRAYRFSVSWPRVMPEGTGRINQEGMRFYEGLVDALLESGIEPWVTLFHWDLPLALHERGGWMNRDIAGWFGEYAAAVTARLSDRVTRWMTINEPQVFIKFGYGDGKIAPGLRLGLGEQLVACHQALRAHGAGSQAIRAEAKKTPSVGWAVVGRTDFPATESAADIEAARRGMMEITAPDLWNNTWYADPVFFGRYPEDGLKLYVAAPGGGAPPVMSGDMELINQPMDFYGVNIYDGRMVKAGGGGVEVVPFDDGHPQTAFRWFITPPCLRWGPRFLWERYGVPVYITENGLSNVDWVMGDGKVHDPQRIDYTAKYLRELRRAIADGADIRGYFHWSLLDNFEWAEGYKERFGLIHVDFPTGTRTVKDSGRWYRRVIETNGGLLDEPGFGMREALRG
jgi:beta-glucosidase